MPSILSRPPLSYSRGQSLIFSKIYLIIARLTTSSFTSEVDRVPTISRFHSAISAFRAPLRSEEWPTGKGKSGRLCFPLVRRQRGLAIYPRAYNRGLEIWISNDQASNPPPSSPLTIGRFQFRILFNRVYGCREFAAFEGVRVVVVVVSKLKKYISGQ